MISLFLLDCYLISLHPQREMGVFVDLSIDQITSARTRHTCFCSGGEKKTLRRHEPTSISERHYRAAVSFVNS